MRTANLHEAKARLSALIDLALAGEEIVIARRNKPIIRLVPVKQARPRPQGGRMRGRIWMAPDFDAPLEDFREYS